MTEPTVDELRRAFALQGVTAPPEYIWIVEHRTLGFDAFTQFEPWHFCGVGEIQSLAKQWPDAGVQGLLVPFARRQDSDDLACFEFAGQTAIAIREVHYDLGPPTYVEIGRPFPTLWDWLAATMQDVKFWFEIMQRRPPPV